MHGRTIYAVLGDWIGWVCGILTILGIGWAIHISRRRNDFGLPQDDKEEKRQKARPAGRERHRRTR
jgi:hypothetical protein